MLTTLYLRLPDHISVPGRPSSLDYSRARSKCTCSRCGWGLFGHFSLVYHFSFLSPSSWETARFRLKYSLKGSLSPKLPTNQKPDYTSVLGSMSVYQIFRNCQCFNDLRVWTYDLCTLTTWFLHQLKIAATYCLFK